jgi:hypothetical protein
LVLTNVLDVSGEHPDALESWHRLIALSEAWNKPEKVEEWRAEFPQMKNAEE